MTKEEYTEAIHDVIYLCACAVNETIPDRNKTAEMNLEFLYKAAQKHSLTAAVAYALESVGIKDPAFEQAKAKSIRKNTLMEFEKNRLFERLEEKGIWYVPLKGCIIKDLYPSLGMRQMADFDILFDQDHAKDLRDIMISLGFSCEEFEKGHHDVYFKKPVISFEMHKSLFSERHKKEIFQYYSSVKKLLAKDDDNQYGYHFSVNDFYIYMIAHENMHYTAGGTGIRSLLDTYVIWKKIGHELDEDYIEAECKKMDIDGFEQNNKRLSMHLFCGNTLTDKDKEMLHYITYSGTYGTLQHKTQNKVNLYGGGKQGKHKYLKNRIFMPMSQIKERYPVVYKHKILLPGLFFYRIAKAVTVNRKETISSLKALRKSK